MTNSPQPHPKESCISIIIKWLFVIVIIVIFLGLLFPPWPGSRIYEAGRNVSALNDEMQIVTGVKAFHVEYGYYPVIGGWQTKKDVYYGTKPIPSALAGTVKYMGANSLLIHILSYDISGADAPIVKSLNPRGVVFLDAPTVKNVDKPHSGIIPDGSPNSGVWFDPWGSPYNVLINASDSGTLLNPYADAPGGAILKNDVLVYIVIVWSFGKNGVLGGGPAISHGFTSESGKAGYYYSKPGDASAPSSGDVISWQPYLAGRNNR